MSDPDKKIAVDRWAEALAWYTTLHGSDETRLTTAVGRAWQDWYADAENRKTFDDVSRLMEQRPVYRERLRPGKEALEQDSYDLSVPIAEWLRAHQPRQRRRRRLHLGIWWWLSGGVAAAAILVLVVLALPRPRLSAGYSAAPAVYQTAVGGLKELRLPDGSSAILGGQTQLRVAFSARRRSVDLIGGQVWLKVAHVPHWPFIVTAGAGTIRDVGTAFLVTRESDRVVVTVTEGAVEVIARPRLSASLISGQQPPAKPDLAPIRVGRGEELDFGDNGALSPIKHTDTRDATGWTHGRLTFDDQPLRYVIETIDRYSSRRIVVSREAGALRFSGIVFDNEIGSWLQSLEAIFPVSIEQRGAIVRIHMRARTPTPR